MEKREMMQTLLDLSNASLALFDLIDDGDITAPIDTDAGVRNLVLLLSKTEDFRQYYAQRNISRMLALGVSPESLLKMAGG